jgi:hypothetical protein
VELNSKGKNIIYEELPFNMVNAPHKNYMQAYLEWNNKNCMLEKLCKLNYSFDYWIIAKSWGDDLRQNTADFWESSQCTKILPIYIK